MSIEVVNEQSFDQSVSEGLVLVDFYADWCGPCKMMIPYLDQIDSELEQVKILKVDVDSSRELAVKNNIRGIPAFVLFKDGKSIATLVGAQTKSNLIEFITQ